MNGMAKGNRMWTHVETGTGSAPRVLLISIAVRPMTTLVAPREMPHPMNSMSMRW